jgi:hypothetical protein
MQTDPTARHSPMGLFQRISYLAHLVRDGRAAAAHRTRPPARHPDRRRARREGQTEVTVDPSGLGVPPEAVRARLAHHWTPCELTGAPGDPPALARPTEPPGLAAQPLPDPIGPRPNAPCSWPSGSAASTPPPNSWGPPGRRCPRPSPATASACQPATPRPPASAAASRPRRPWIRRSWPSTLISFRPESGHQPSSISRALSVGPPPGAVRHLGRQRGGRAVQRKPRPPANHPGLGDHPTSRPQPSAANQRASRPTAATPTKPTAPADPSNPRSERWWPIPADPPARPVRLRAAVRQESAGSFAPPLALGKHRASR